MRRGFTLIEMLLVISMLSIVALLFVSYSGDVGNVSVDALSRKMQSDIRYAQQLATTTGSTHGVLFNSGNYVVYRGVESSPVLDPVDRTQMVESVAEYGQVSIGNSYRVEFNKLGAPIVGGGGNVEIVAASGAKRRIYVIENTGAVLVDVLDYGSGCSCRMGDLQR